MMTTKATRAIGKPRRAVKKKTRFVIPVAAVLLITAGVYMMIRPGLAGGGPRDLEGHPVIPEDPIATTSEFIEATDMTIGEDKNGFQIPAVKLSVRLGAINDVAGVMNPPDYTSVFWVRNRGVSLSAAEKGTVYLVTHSTRGGSSPGNYIQKNQQVILSPGDTIRVEDREYAVTTSRIIKKADIGNEWDLWDGSIPRRLVLITCLSNPGSNTTDSNIVIIGTLVR